MALVICDHYTPRRRRCWGCEHAVEHLLERGISGCDCSLPIPCRMARPYLPDTRCVPVKERKEAT
jgi:hypothetical protein